jgi:hypothetical protein
MHAQLFRYRVRLTYLTALLVPMIAGGGCTNIIDEVNNRQSSPSKPVPAPPRGEFIDETDDGTLTQPNRAAPIANQTRSPAALTPSAPPIHLSAGVALAQTFPSGTGMSFSVDYQFREGGPNASNRYVWVIEGQGGKSLEEQPVQLGGDGNLPLIVPRLRPEAGPFSSHIVEITPDGLRQKVSRSVPMR